MARSAEGGLSPRYRVFETGQFQRDLSRLGPAAKRRLEAKLREHVYPTLRQSPHFGPNIKRLRNWEPPTWRTRVGDWRFFYEIDEPHRLVLMTVADHRREAYG
jgi:mRNA interferase RelE/StbE